MNKFKSRRIHRILALTLALSVLLTSCGGGGVSAATMHLRKTLGTVGVSDGEGKDVEPREDLGLYSGYGVDTQAESYAWIDLDEVKLTKLDQDSEIAITQEGKKLEIEVKTGSLFFNVTEPLEDDETLNIRTSTMLVGIRGTCGWVTQDAAALLEGTVEVTAGDQSVTVAAGEMATVAEDGQITVKEFSMLDIPAFAEAELDGLEQIDNTLSLLEERQEADRTRKAALLEALDNNSGASYAGLFDVDGDGREDLLLLNQVGQYANFRWTAYLWDGNAAQPMDLTHTYSSEYDTYTTDDVFTVTAAVCRERDTGIIYVRYYGEYVGGAYSDYFVSTTGSEEINAPFWGGGYDGQEGGYEAWLQQKEQEQQQYDAMLANRFETLVELSVGGFDGVGDYTNTLGDVRQQLEAE